MKRAYLISPYSGDTERNVKYALKAMHHCFAIGYSPYASHIFLAASGCLDDNDPKDRDFGFQAGYAFLAVCEKAFVFMDLGVSRGMRADLDAARRLAIPIDYVSIVAGVVPTVDAIHRLMLPHEHMPCAACQIEKERTEELKNG